ncbi:MAG: hypothetical protein KGZ65_06830 [Sphingomonadales bacterium]|nr:hypothetical protein [Sphingomonadaceae bacterium]MBS3930933.1 hypothetical protein [Sphingomonadales bacterium]
MLTIAHATAYCLIGVYLLTSAGNFACRLLFHTSGMKAAIEATDEATKSAGRIIGSLERIVLASTIIVGRWEILAAVIALKTIARFKELDKQLNAEYFLIGSLFSVIWSMAITGAWIAYDHRFGADIHHSLVALVEHKDAAK